ncbi:MAG TPA: TonB family protein [Blastocatellia bacterium]|nr:TonB family protein [Blastocatellia bacterium]
MSSVERSMCRLACTLLTLNLCFASTAFAQEPQPEEPQPPKIIRKSGGVLQGSATRRVEPVYPPLAKAAQVRGSVVVEVTIDEEGAVISTRAISGHPLLKDAAVAVARGWRFSQTKLQGVPVKVIGTITFNFNLDGPSEIEKWSQQLAVNPDSPELHFKLGMAYSRDDQAEKAIDEYNEALRLKPDYADAHLWLGRAHKGQSHYDLAIEAFKHALSLKPADAEELHMEMARSYLRLDRLDEAVDAAKRALSTRPDFMEADEAHALVGLVLIQQGRYDQAVEYLKEAVNLNPNLTLHVYLGVAYAKAGDRDSAMNEYRFLKEKEQPALANQLMQFLNKQK